MKKRIGILLLAAALLCGCGNAAPTPTEPPETVDPYAGMVQVESGYGTRMWVTEYEDVPVSTLTAADFQEGEYTGSRYVVRKGIDVSEHQGLINWEAVANSGVEFAIIRAGYRGYGKAGTLNIDPHFYENIGLAATNGIDIGVYFFSQATSVEEAEAEADFLLEMLEFFGGAYVTLPVYYDWEPITYDDARTDGVDGDTVTACAAAFCEKIAAAGYEAGVYAYRYLGYFSYDLRQLTDYSLWIGAVGD